MCYKNFWCSWLLWGIVLNWIRSQDKTIEITYHNANRYELFNANIQCSVILNTIVNMGDERNYFFMTVRQRWMTFCLVIKRNQFFFLWRKRWKKGAKEWKFLRLLCSSITFETAFGLNSDSSCQFRLLFFGWNVKKYFFLHKTRCWWWTNAHE